MEIECTQRLECTQELYNTQTQRTDPEQIGFLGIHGTKYPVKRGPNKIGRDPTTCHIHLDLHSISRQHAVINVLSMTEFMLMDLDSANKTKVQGKTLQPYIPYPLKNGDMVQFGEMFGVFRLFEDDTDLPMTQALDLPCTPAPVPKQMSRLVAPSVLVPESPEVSDMDDSFVMPSQPKKSSEFKSPMNKFITHSYKTVAIQPMGSKTIDNAYWISAKKSDSFNFQLDDSGSTLNDSAISNKSNKAVEECNDNIHEIETQAPFKANDSTDSIYTANTQLPPSLSIHCMETQRPPSDIYVQETQQVSDIHALDTQNVSDTANVHDRDTQSPVINNLPKVCKLENQEDLQIDLLTSNKENENSIFNAETQAFPMQNEEIVLKKPEHTNTSIHETSKDKIDSDEEILFDELNTQSFHDECESQPLIPANMSPQIKGIENVEVSLTRTRKESGSSTDCEDVDILPGQTDAFDMLPTQKIDCNIGMLPTQNNGNDIHMMKTQKLFDDIEMLPTQKIENDDDDDLTDCEDEVVKYEGKDLKDSPEIDFQDMATQIIGSDEIDAAIKKTKDEVYDTSKETIFEELPTQLITDDSKEDNFEDLPTQVLETNEDQGKESNNEAYSEEIISPFKVPFPTPYKNKKTAKLDQLKPPTPKIIVTKDDDEDNYYSATQEILNDLCTQISKPSVEAEIKSSVTNERTFTSILQSELLDKIECNSNRNTRIPRKHLTKENSGTSSSDAVLKTPKTLKIINAELPDSQEIKTSVTLKDKSITESSSDSETDDVSDQESGIVYGKKRKPKIYAKMDLSKKFEDSLPTRIITRVRKPTLKIRESDESSKHQCKSILKNTVMVDSDDNIDAEIINENISRLKSKTDKKRDKESSHDKKQPNEQKKRSHSRNENKNTAKTTEAPAQDNVRKSSRSRSKKAEELKSKTDEHDHSKDMKVRSTRSTRTKTNNDVKDDKSKTGLDKRESNEKDRSHGDSKARGESKSRSDSNSRSKARSSSKENKSKNTKIRDRSKHDKTESSPDIDVRRSSRQKSKDNIEVTPKHENSTVYLSSESSTESPKNLKRPACNELDVPSPKRTRSLPTSKSSSTCSSVSASANTASADTSVCSTPVRVDTHYVLFTAFSNDEVRTVLEKLGAVLVTDVMACTVLVTLQVKRTFKLLCAVGLGRPVVGPDWVQACVDTKTIVDPWLYIIKDVPAEKRFRFSLEKTLRGKRNFLKGFNVSSTPSVLPNAQEMKLIVECSGGVWKASGPRWICVTCSADRALWAALRRRGAALVSTEFILGGVLRQHADVEATAFGAPATKKKGAAGEFVCTECGRRCLSRIGLTSHARSHTKS